MTLAELLSALQKKPSDPIALELLALLEAWKSSPDTADDLYQSAERLFGNSCITSETGHKKVYALWSAFTNMCISGRGGMTVNERLYCFDLFDAWDTAESDENRDFIRHKIDL